MKIRDYLASLPAALRERELGRLEGMSLAMRICRNRAEDLRETNQPLSAAEASEICASTIRFVQVQIGSGRQSFEDGLGGLSPAELEELWRIY